jgi:hypothetical protein
VRTITDWVQRARRRWAGGLNPQHVDAIAVELADRVKLGEIPALGFITKLQEIDGLSDAWLGTFRRDLRAALAPYDRVQQMIALRQLAVSYLARSNDGWRVVKRGRLTDAERDLALELRRAPALAQALTEVGKEATGANLRLNKFGLVDANAKATADQEKLTAQVNLRYKQLLLDGVLANASLIALEILAKRFLSEHLLNDDEAALSMAVSDHHRTIGFKALASIDALDRSSHAGPRSIERFVGKCLEGISVSIAANSVHPAHSHQGKPGHPLRLEARDWGQVFLQRRNRRLGDIRQGIAAVVWAGMDPLLAEGVGWIRGAQYNVLPEVIKYDLCSVLFVACAAGVEVDAESDLREILSILSKLASSRGTLEFADQREGEEARRTATSLESRLLALQMWLVAFDADPTAGTRVFSPIASKLAGIASLAYMEPVERVAVFALVKYFLLQEAIALDGAVAGANRLPPNWKDAYAVYLRREQQLMRTVAVLLSA